MRYASILLLFLLASCSMSDNTDEVKPSDNIINVGSPLPTFSVFVHDVYTMNDGTTQPTFSNARLVTTDSLRGKPSVIIFFNTTCPDCQRELPALNSRFLRSNTDTTFVAISRQEAFDAVSSYWLQHNLSIPFSAQSDRAVYSLFAKKGIPRIYISNANCTVVKVISAQ